MDIHKENMFSVIIPLFNREELIIETLQSISNQTYRNFEVIVVNDGSTDKSGQIALKSIETLGINGKVLHIANSGHGAARDHGIQNASGNILAPIDSDDLWLPDFLNNMNSSIIALGNDATNCIFFSDFNLFFEDGEYEVNKYESLNSFHLLNKTKLSKNIFKIEDDLFTYLLQEQPIFWGAVCFSRDLYERLGPIGKHIPGKSGSPVEWEFFLRCSYNKTTGVYLKEMNTKIRRHMNNMSRDLTTQFEGELEILKLLPDLLSLNEDYLYLVKHQIHKRTFSCGYQYFDQYVMKSARKCFFKTMFTKLWLKSIYYFILTIVPVHILKKIR